MDLLEIKGLTTHFFTRAGVIKAVDNLSLRLQKDRVLGLVGESGCGKTTVGRTMLRLIEPTAGSVLYDNKDVFSLRPHELKAVRRDMQIIFQDPYASLDPRVPIGESVMEGLHIHNIGTPKERVDIMMETLKKVGLETYHARRYPHEFSGGQRQRIGIARALALRPKFVVCDEPVSALDVSIQSQVLNILKDLQREFGLTYLFIAHNLGVVEHISDRVAVMYLGKMAELADRVELYKRPLHPYSQALMSAIPVADPKLKRKRMILKGDVPSPLHPPSGCRFHPRCPFAWEKCRAEMPPLLPAGQGRQARCWLVAEPARRRTDAPTHQVRSSPTSDGAP